MVTLVMTWEPIWFARKWATTVRGYVDGSVYAIATGANFALLWPAAATGS